MTNVSDIITTETNYTKQMVAATDTVTGAESENLSQSDFLSLLTEQLQFQDPMEPQDNSEFISQMCQFSQLNVSTETYEAFTDYVGESKANSLVGEGVVLTDPTDDTKTISGTVEAAYLDGADSAVTVNGTTYSMEYLLYSYDPSSVTTSSE
jgi:flagellar basal-body rod modification protein FlgD